MRGVERGKEREMAWEKEGKRERRQLGAGEVAWWSSELRLGRNHELQREELFIELVKEGGEREKDLEATCYLAIWGFLIF